MQHTFATETRPNILRAWLAAAWFWSSSFSSTWPSNRTRIAKVLQGFESNSVVVAASLNRFARSPARLSDDTDGLQPLLGTRPFRARIFRTQLSSCRDRGSQVTQACNRFEGVTNSDNGERNPRRMASAPPRKWHWAACMMRDSPCLLFRRCQSLIQP